MVVEALPPASKGFTMGEPRLTTEMVRHSPEDWEVLNALQNFGEPQPISPTWAIFNAAMIPAPEFSPSASIIISRAVYIPNIREGEPDRNSLHVCLKDLNGGNVQRLPNLALPIDKRIVNWEDARVGGPNDRTLGFTVVLSEDGKYSPHPSLVDVKIKDGSLKVAGDPRIFGNLIGKNVIPLEDGLIYRPEEFTHELHYLDSRGELLRTIDFSDFRDIPWLSKKMGAVAKPIELEDGNKLLFIHGVRGNQLGIDGKLKTDIYAIGLAMLDKNWQVLNVDREPLLTRKDFLRNLDPSMDINPKKEVTYLCDVHHIQKGKYGLILPVNVGDRITVLMFVSYAELKPRIANLLLPRFSPALAA